MPSRIEILTGTIMVAEDYDEVREALESYDTMGRYKEFTQYQAPSLNPTDKSLEEQPVTIDLDKYVSHCPVIEEDHVDPTPHPAMIGDH